MGVGKRLAKGLAPMATRIAPSLTAGFLRDVLKLAIAGFGPLPGAEAAAQARLESSGNDVDKAIHDLIESHVRLAGAQGFVTNLGGLITMAVAVPANVSGVALLQCHLVAAIAHLRGYDLQDPRVRNAVLACLLGEDGLKLLLKSGTLPSTPMSIATAPAHDPGLDQLIASEVTAALIARISGRKVVTSVARRTPVLGGGIGAVSDGYATYRVGRYADRELLPRTTPRVGTGAGTR
jgi:hypothetical protein